MLSPRNMLCFSCCCSRGGGLITFLFRLAKGGVRHEKDCGVVGCGGFAVLLVSGVWSTAAQEAEGATAKPNIVFILADDMRKDDLKYMPKTRSVLGDKGMNFS